MGGSALSAERLVGELREHPAASLVPAMSADEYESFRADIAARGIWKPLEISKGGVVLDGRHRLRAARELGITRVPVRVVAPPDEVEFMLLAALSRRHLSQSQKAALIVDLDSYRNREQQSRRLQQAGLRHQRLVVANLPPRGERTREHGARIAGCSARLVQDAVSVRDADPALFEQVKAGSLPLHRARRQLKRASRHAAIGQTPPLPRGPFALILADPPWQTSNPDSDYAPEQYYPTMTLDQLKQLPVPAAEDALLYLWTIHSHLPQALELMEAWGFQHRSDEIWIKDRIGMGVWSRYRHEQLLIGRKGNASPPEPKLRLESVFEAPLRRHSEKPTCIYERLEHLYPHLSKLELFARGKPRPGWTAWGNEVETP